MLFIFLPYAMFINELEIKIRKNTYKYLKVATNSLKLKVFSVSLKY